MSSSPPLSFAQLLQALALARAAGGRRVLSFTVGGARGAIDIRSVPDLLEYRTVTTLPAMPPGLRGVIDWRGAVVPVVDLAVRLGLGSTVPGRQTLIAVVDLRRDGPPLAMGLVLDGADGVHALDSAGHPPAAAPGDAIPAAFIASTARADGRTLALLDLRQALADERFIALARPAAGSGA